MLSNGEYLFNECVGVAGGEGQSPILFLNVTPTMFKRESGVEREYTPEF